MVMMSIFVRSRSWHPEWAFLAVFYRQPRRRDNSRPNGIIGTRCAIMSVPSPCLHPLASQHVGGSLGPCSFPPARRDMMLLQPGDQDACACIFFPCTAVASGQAAEEPEQECHVFIKQKTGRTRKRGTCSYTVPSDKGMCREGTRRKTGQN